MRLTFLDHLLLATLTALLFVMVLLFLHSHPSVLAPFEMPQAMSGELDNADITGLQPTDCGEACHRPDTPGTPRFWSLEAEEGYCATWANTAMRIAEGRDLGIDPQTAMAEIRMHVASPEAAVKGVGLVGQVYGPDAAMTPAEVRLYQYTACSLKNGGGA